MGWSEPLTTPLTLRSLVPDSYGLLPDSCSSLSLVAARPSCPSLKAMTIGQLSAAIALGAAVGIASASCARANAHTSVDVDTLYIGVAAAHGSAAYFRGVALAIDRLNAERPSATHPFALRMPSMAQ